MTELQETYTVDAAPSPDDDQIPVKDVILTLAGQVQDLQDQQEAAAELHLETVAALSRRIDKLQDANLAPVLEASAVVVELRRIADTLEDLADKQADAYGALRAYVQEHSNG